MLFSYFCNLNDFDSAQQVLDDIPSHFRLGTEDQDIYDKLVTLLPLLKSFTNKNFGYNMPDSLQIEILNAMSSSDNTLPGALARNILTVCGLITYEEPIVTATTLKYMILANQKEIISKKSDFIVFPNPCKTYIVTKCVKDFVFSIDLLDKSGKKISSYTSGKSNQLMIMMQNLSAGIYFLKINVNGTQKEIKKIIHIN